MALMLKRQRNGRLRAEWYGTFTEDGVRKVANLGVKVEGIPPASGRVGDPGNAEFEVSRKAAKDALVLLVEEAQRKGRAEHLTERLIEMKTGSAPEYVKIQDLCDRWLSLPRDTALSEGRTIAYKSFFKRFCAFMSERKPTAQFIYQVTAADVAAFCTSVRIKMSPESYAGHMRTLRPAFDRFLPVGATNPFRTGMKKRMGQGGDSSVHRKPFTPAELTALLSVAREDAFMYPLIVTAACSGMRRGDVCGLRWADVDLDAGMLTVKTSKTGSEVEIPIFKPLHDVLAARQGNDPEYVFPEAARMLKANRYGLTWRFKKIVAKALSTSEKNRTAPVTPSPELEQEGAIAVRAKIPKGERRDRILDTLTRYCNGQSIRQIAESTGRPKVTLSADLHAVQDLIGKPLVRTQGPDMKSLIATTTRVAREKGHGMLSASLYDWHALRTTFVTLALTAGVPLELVRRVTGHGTVEIVLKHYFRPGRAEFKAALTEALPEVITGTKRVVEAPFKEISSLALKLADGNGTDAERQRLRECLALV